MPANPNYVTAHVTLPARQALRDLALSAISPQGRPVNMSEALLAAISAAEEHPETFHRHLSEVLDNKVDGRRTDSSQGAAA